MATPDLAARYPADLSQSDEFRIWHCKILPCRKRYSHDWNDCVFAHPGEKIQRRCPRKYSYGGVMCPDIKKFSVCPRGDSCCYAHNSFEYWLHPSRYRTEMCTFGPACTRSVCFFAHQPSELRAPLDLAAAPASFHMAFDALGASPTSPMHPLTPTATVHSTPSASPRADPAAWSMAEVAACNPDLASAMGGLSLARQGAPAPLPVPSYTDAAPCPSPGSLATYPLLLPQSTSPYPTLAHDGARAPQPTLAPPSTVPPTLRRATMPSIPPTLTPRPTRDQAARPTLRAAAPPSFSTNPYPSPSAVIIASTAAAGPPPHQLLALPPYQQTCFDTEAFPLTTPASSLGFDDTGVPQQLAATSDTFYADCPASLQQWSVPGLMAPVPYADAIGSMALAAQVASSSGLMYPYCQ